MSQLTAVYGCGADLVQLDCGQPIADPALDTYLKLCKFVNMRFTPVYADGTELSLNDAKGRPIVDQESCGYLSRYDIEIEFGGIHPAYAAYLTGDRISTTGRGAGIGQRDDCPPWFSLRVWQELAGNGRKICETGEEEYVLHWLPCVTNFRHSGDWEIGEDTITRVTMTATAYPNGGTFGNGHWGEYTYSDLAGDPNIPDGGAYAEEIHLYEVVSDPAPPDCGGDDCELIPFDGPAPEGGRVGEGLVAPGAPTPPKSDKKDEKKAA